MEEQTLVGYVDSIIYQNEETGYTVMEVITQKKTLTFVGNFPYIHEGEYVEAVGSYIEHPVYGEQFQVESITCEPPKNLAAIEHYLASGAIKGIKAVLAGKIVAKFKEDTFRIIEEEPEQLVKIKGISERKAREIATQVANEKGRREAIIFLQKYKISLNLALKIYNFYKESVYQVIQTNPYQLAEDVPGVGFKIADEIAKESGILVDSQYRIKSAILYVLSQAAGQGHMYLPRIKLIQMVEELLGVSLRDEQDFFMDLVMNRKIIIKELNEESIVYLSMFYYMELETARLLHDLNDEYEVDEDELNESMNQIEEALEISLDGEQKEAVKACAGHGLLILTGGPGTGKTTTIESILYYFEQQNLDVVLAAPTGRAAKRISETTGREAKTIHRLLEVKGISEEESEHSRFERNEENPLETDVIIIDEMSMVDIYLIHALLKAVVIGTRLILVGDINQLPSVGPGNILKDLIQSECFPVIRLQKIFRQASTSDIVVNAHKINEGKSIDSSKRSKDFLFIKRPDANSIINASLTLAMKKLPDYVHASIHEIQVMTPMRKGALGVERLNKILQEYMNPPENSKREKEIGGTIYRVGDKVMQIKNNYKLEWEIKNSRGFVLEEGMGVFNGDTGIIREINLFTEELIVEFDESKFVTYSFKQLDELDLAYAITVHKSQGSEYPAVILPLLSGPSMLMNRNLLYTAVTRAKSCVCIVGSVDEFERMIKNESQQLRYSSLAIRIKEMDLIGQIDEFTFS
ncbi:RecD-like DNA helicase YrrC [Lachnospiraceae bacterium TWA4]|nr:RecD-like DNA helicase YrrC [Lachnospiraceae bacterium TWA4]